MSAGGANTGWGKTVSLLALLPLLAGCYHMRVEAEAIEPRVVEVSRSPAEALRRIRRLMENDMRLRIMAEENDGATLVTAPWHFYTDTGFGQPAGGRKYYTQLRINVLARSGGSTVTLAHYNYEIRTSYAYGQDGQVMTMYKHYPHEHYPGMFDNAPLIKELKGVSDAIVRVCHD